MNTTENSSNTGAAPAAVTNPTPAPATPKGKPGRKPNPSLTRTIRLNMDGTPRGKGKPKVGTQYREVVIGRHETYVKDQTVFRSEKVLTVEAKPQIVVASSPSTSTTSEATPQPVATAPASEATPAPIAA